ncbi:MAG: TonB-dependent receptor [Acidobacteria bacterium]|nr:TonB-dependent receptor [Acidobacteriota bacterium]
MHSLRLTFLVLFLAVVTAVPALAQDDVTIRGRITTVADGLSLPGASVTIPTLKLSAETSQEGTYALVVPAAQVKGQLVELRVTFTGLQPQTTNVILTPGQITRDFAMAFGFHEEITVGSRLGGAAAEQAVPVDVLTAQQIERTGASETNQIIQALAPSFNFPRPTITDGTDSVRPATLRGLGPDQVLVLINGKRRHAGALVHVNGSIGRGSTGVDLNAIPASAIQRIEILRDGAAAQYGSDAIAGVINIVLKNGVNPLTVSAKAGMTTHDDGGLFDVGASKGWEIGRGGLFATIEFRDRGETNRAGPDPRDQIVAGDAGRNSVSQPNFHYGDADTRDVMTFVNAEFPVTAGTTSVYAFGGLSRRTGSHGGFFRRALQDTNIPQIYPEGYLPLIEPDIIDFSGTAGLRGTRADWFWDASAQYGYNSFDFNVRDSLNVSLGPVNNQSEFYSGSLVFDQFLTNLGVARQVNVGMAGPLNVALGAEFRRETYQIIAGEPNSYIDGGFPNQFGGRAVPGAQVFPGFRPSNEVDTGRNSVATYLDLEGNVLNRLRLGVAGRFEHYTDFGNTGDGKVTARLEPHPAFVVRGAVSTGFRAPSLPQSYFSAISTNFLNLGGQLVPFEVGTFPVSSPQARVLGAVDLKPEQSVHWSGGLVWNPIAPVEITADIYRIDIDDRIAISGNFNDPSIAQLLLPLGATGARFFTNAIDTRTNGADLTASYTADLGRPGRVKVSAAYNTTENKIRRIADTPPQLAGFQSVLFDRVERRRVECGQPQNNYRFAGDWNRTRFGGIARVARYGEVCSVDRTVTINGVPQDQDFAAQWVTDVEATVQFGKALLGIGVQNLFDSFPDESIFVNSNTGILPYPSNAPAGFNGRFGYARMTYRF